MTQRERFIAYMSFKEVDRTPLMDMGIWPETIERWHHEGLPKWITSLRHLEDYLGLDLSFNVNWLPIDGEIYPPFVPTILEEDTDTQTVSDEMGVVSRQRKRHKTIPHYIRFPVTNAGDYEKLLPRLDGKNPDRYPKDFDEDLHWRVKRGEIVGLNFRSFFGFPRKIIGFENWCMAFFDQPDLVRRIIADRLQFAKDLFKRVLSTGMVDFVQVWEDMAFKTASMISPELVKEFMLPAYIELVSFFREYKVALIMVDCDGYVLDLLPIWLEAGIDGCHPCEIAAGSDPAEIRKKYPKCTLFGGVDKRMIARGKDGVDAELNRIESVVKEGAFIPMIDHFVPPDISYETFLYYIEKKRRQLS